MYRAESMISGQRGGQWERASTPMWVATYISGGKDTSEMYYTISQHCYGSLSSELH